MNDFLQRKSVQQFMWWLIGVVVIVGGGWTVTPILIGYTHRADGYKYLIQALEILGDQNPEPDFCVEGGIADPKAMELVNQAIGALEKARTAMPTDSQTLLLLGRGYCLSGRAEEAVEVYEAYTQLRPKNPLGHLELGFAYESQCLNQVIYFEDDSDGEKAWDHCREPEIAEKIRIEWKAGGASAQNFLEIGNEEVAASHYIEALVWYRRANVVFPEWGIPFVKSGIVYNLLKEWGDAGEALQKAIELKTEDRDVLYQLGTSYEGGQDWDKALAVYEDAIIKPGEVGASVILFRIGWIHQYQLNPRDIKGARIAYDEALRLNNFNHPWQRGDVYYHDGILYTWQADWNQAIHEFQQTLVYSPHHYWAHVSLAKAFWETGNFEIAKEYATKAIYIDPDKQNAYFILADILLTEGDINSVRAIYEKLLKNDPQNTEIITRLNMLPNKDTLP